MTTNAFVPLHVDAWYAAKAQAVPALTDAAFGAPSAQMDEGVHVHWALPDALTHGEMVNDVLRFPAVPDRYLVVRLNPSTGLSRTGRAWCVDARTLKISPVGPWDAPPAGPRPWLTAVGEGQEGESPNSDDLGRRLFDGAYAPASRGRFALFDPLDDHIVPKNLTYIVLGWYARPDEDPLFRAGMSAPNEAGQARARARWCRDHGLRGTGLETYAPPPVSVPTLVTGGVFAGHLNPLLVGLMMPQLGATALHRAVVPKALFPKHLVAHGACFGVGADVQPPNDGPARVALHLSQQRAAVAQANPAQAGALEAALVGFSDASTSGLARLPDLAHAAGFLAHPGETPESARYFRPTSPVLTVRGVGRVFRHNEDGRLDPHGQAGTTGAVLMRTDEEVVRRLQVRAFKGDVNAIQVAVAGTDVLQLNLPGQPAFAPGLLQEAALLDPEAIDQLAGLGLLGATPPANDTRAEWLDATRWALQKRALAFFDRLDAPDPTLLPGIAPARIATQRYLNHLQPLFLEVEVTVRPTVVGGSEAAVPSGSTLPGPELAVPSTATLAAAPFTWKGRWPLTASIADLLARALQLEGADRSDLLSVALTGLDAALAARTDLRSGSLAVQRLQVLDLFGRTRTLPVAGLSLTLPPRLTHWGRLSFRFPEPGAVAGYLRPDFVDHALEAFDPLGQPLGQLAAHADGVRWTPSPLAADLKPNLALSDPRRVVPNDLTELLALVDAVLVAGPREGGHSRLSALIALIERARSTTHTFETTAALFGRPVALVRAAYQLEAAEITEQVSPAGLPSGLMLRLGDVNDTGDGVFACWLVSDVGAGAGLPRLRPVDGALGTPNHTFLQGSSLLPLTGVTTSMVLLMDPQASIKATTGVQPTKVLTLPTEWTQAALRALRPTLAFGPLLLPGGRAHLPAPHAVGLDWRWVTHHRTENGGVEARLAPLESADGKALYDSPIQAQEGWLAAVEEGAASPDRKQIR